jgi:hypothetical protein
LTAGKVIRIGGAGYLLSDLLRLPTEGEDMGPMTARFLKEWVGDSKE